MSNKSLWNLIIKIASFLAIVFLFLAAALSYISHFSSPQNPAALVLTVIFAAGLAAFTLVTAHFSNIKLERELKNATKIARQIAGGEIVENIDTDESELLAALEDISDSLRNIIVQADQISTGDLSANIALRSDADIFGQSLQSMIEKLRSLIQTQEERDYLQQSILKLLCEVSQIAAGDLTAQAKVSPETTGAIAEAFNTKTK